ncbi:MAG TPA: ribonuclease P [Candidatus Bathyarchaeota archaeon]|nr:ribonuclease P [Candidatus Bathyarchaeota archaeon]
MPVEALRRRYLAFKVEGETVKRRDLEEAIKGSVKRLYGLNGLWKLEPTLIDFDEHHRIGIVRCNHRWLPWMRASLTAITEVEGKPIALHVLRVSGTLRALRRKIKFGIKDI